MKRYRLALFFVVCLIVPFCISRTISISNNPAIFLNNQVGQFFDTSLFTEKFGEPIGTFDREGFWEAHYEFKVTNPEIYKKTGYVGIVIRISKDKVVSWTRITD